MSFLSPNIDKHVITAMQLFSRGLLRFVIFKLSPSLTNIVLEEPSPDHISIINLINNNNTKSNLPQGDFFSDLPVDALRQIISYWTLRELGILVLTSWGWHNKICQIRDLVEEICESPFTKFGTEHTSWENLTVYLPENASRFALYFPTDEERKIKPADSGPKNHKFIFVYWCPSSEKIRQKMVYTASKLHLKTFVKSHVKGSVALLELDTIHEGGIEDLRDAIHSWFGLDEFDEI